MYDHLEGDDSYSAGIILCCNPALDSDVRHCNFIFWDNLESNVGKKVWNVISNLGVVSKDNNKDYSKKIAEMEAKDKAIFNGKSVISNCAS